MPESRGSDRTPYRYTMKTPGRQTPSGVLHGYSHSHSHSSSHSHAAPPTLRTSRGSRPTTPVASPKMPPYSVGQSHPPRLSPAPRGSSEKRSSSPSYFGLVVDDSVDPRDSSLMPRHNWSPPSSSVRPFAAAVPKQVPLDANPEFEAFKRQVDAFRGKGLALSTTTYMSQVTKSPTRPKPPRWQTHVSDSTNSDTPSTKDGSYSGQDGVTDTNRMDLDQDSLHDSAYVSGDSKRNSEACLAPPPIVNLSPPDSVDRFLESPQQPMTLSKVEDRDPRLSVMGGRVDLPSPTSNAPRPYTTPPKIETGPVMIMPDQLRDMMEDSDIRMLLLDIRSAQGYAQSHIRSSLNLCIPTTLLKRATFNLQKLQQTFQRPEHLGAFSQWRETDCLIVYDALSSEKTEAMTAMNMIKKFTNEGYKGSTYILRGGFRLFAEEYPELVYTHTSDSPVSPGGICGGLAPVIGGVLLPIASNTPNPFFSNIRQNVELANGVGQMDIEKPKGLASPTLPKWLRDATEEKNHGKIVSDKFLKIERDEQSRMKEAYSMLNRDPSNCKPGAVQLCGIEQGGKNRYKDILPFEHTRVKLPSQPDGRSDYINASHVKASGSNKRYLSSQGPLPATFEDFWTVIWDQDVRVVVMLTAESEGGQLKCHTYWKSREYGLVRLKMLSEKKVSLDIDNKPGDSPAPQPFPAAEMGRRRAHTTTAFDTTSSAASPQPPRPAGETPYVIIRKFALSHAAHPFEPMREVTHLHYPSWPDFGAPAQPSHLLALVELANVMQNTSLPVETTSVASSRKSSLMSMTWTEEPEGDRRVRPMLVHCSAGCGRTGAFCTVDSVVDMLKRQRIAKSKSNSITRNDTDADVDMSDATPVPALAPQRSLVSSPLSDNGSGSSFLSRRSSTENPYRGASLETPTLDLSWLGDDTADLIQRTVEEFRGQRLSMVQSLRQFVLCYETVLEWIWRVQERENYSDPVLRGRTRSGSLQMRREG